MRRRQRAAEWLCPPGRTLMSGSRTGSCPRCEDRPRPGSEARHRAGVGRAKPAVSGRRRTSPNTPIPALTTARPLTTAAAVRSRRRSPSAGVSAACESAAISGTGTGAADQDQDHQGYAREQDADQGGEGINCRRVRAGDDRELPDETEDRDADQADRDVSRRRAGRSRRRRSPAGSRSRRSGRSCHCSRRSGSRTTSTPQE